MINVILGVVLMIGIIILLISYICFRMVFYVSRKNEKPSSGISLPLGKLYEPYHEQMRRWALEARNMPQEDFTITSFDGLKLHGTYYEYSKDAVIEIMFHGYKGNAERDLSGGVQRCFALGRSVLKVDQRTSRGSEGSVISFGINEHRDCLAWVDFVISHFGPDVKIVLTGLSMGASTVLMAAGRDLPENVVGILADCGFSSPKEIILKCAKDMGYPPQLVYPFIKLGAGIYGKFDLEEYSPLEAMKTCKLPVLFFHGEDDDLVPYEMSRKMFEACKSPKRLVTVKGAGHGLVYVVDNELYFKAVTEFFSENGVLTETVSKVM